MKWKNLQKPKKLEKEDVNDKFGRFISEPFERGYAVAIGNALRRILLSSIPGAAVTSVKIEGVQHEFATIKGVVEDVSEIILNIKQLQLEGRKAMSAAEFMRGQPGIIGDILGRHHSYVNPMPEEIERPGTE